MSIKIKKLELESYIDAISNFEKLKFEEQIIVFGYYLQQNLKVSNFDHKTIQQCFELSDFPHPTNIASRLPKLEKKHWLVKNNGGYRLERATLKSLERDILGKPQLKIISSKLESLPKLLKTPEKEYVDEVIGCLRINAYRAAIVLMWSICISHLRNYIIDHKMHEFNDALLNHPKNSIKKLSISKYDDFEDIGDYDFLEILKSTIISKNQHKLLKEKLDIRNTYAHPNTLTLTDNKINSFIEDLVNDIITKIN